MGLLYILAYISVTDPWVGAETERSEQKNKRHHRKGDTAFMGKNRFYSGCSIQAIA